MKNHKYIIIARPADDNPSWGWEQALQRTTGITHTFKKAYEVGLFLAGVTKPDMKYRKALDRVKKLGAVELCQVGGQHGVTIVMSKLY